VPYKLTPAAGLPWLNFTPIALDAFVLFFVFFFTKQYPPSLQKLLKRFRLTNLTKIWFNLQMSVTFSLFVCSGFNVLCCFRPTDSAEEPEIIYRPAATTLESTMQLALDLPTSATTTQIRSELPAATDLALARHP